MRSPVRDFGVIRRRLEKLSVPGGRLDVLGQVKGFPLYQVCLEGRSAGQVLISTGIHGDEPAGVEAALSFLENKAVDWLENFSFVVFPCINPWGYVYNTRENCDQIDLNRACEDNKADEVRLVKTAVAGRRFLFNADLHEDWEAAGYYMYEGRHNRQWLAGRILEQVGKVGPIDDETSESEIPLVPGALEIEPSWGVQGLAPYMLQHHTEHALIGETPSIKWPLQQRVQAHLAALEAMLGYYRDQS